MPGRDNTKTSPADKAAHYHGHRRRLRQRFLAAGSEAISDYEMLELILFRAIPQRDVKPLAKDLLATFGSFSEVIAAPAERLNEVDGLGEAAITELKIVQAAANRLVRGEVKQRQVLSSWSNVLDYCRAAMAFESKEHFRILFLDKGNHLIADEQHQTGTVDHTPVENVWQFMRDNWLSNCIFKSYDDLVDHCCAAWNKLVDQPWRIMSIGLRQWAHGF